MAYLAGTGLKQRTDGMTNMISNPRHAAIAAALILTLTAGLAGAAAPAVSNVSAAQRPGTMLVDIDYDLDDADGEFLWVTVYCSIDGGANYAIACTSVTGDVGGPMVAGPGKSLVWDARLDAPGLELDTVAIRVFARDTPPDPLIARFWRSNLDGSGRRPFAFGDTIGFGQPLRLEWEGETPLTETMPPHLIAERDTVYPYDDGLLGYKWQLRGELGGNCIPTLEDCWHPRKFNEATGDSFSYFGDNNLLTFLNDGSGSGPFRSLLPSGVVAMQLNTLDIDGLEVPPHGQDFEFVVNHDPDTILLDGETDWAHPSDFQVYPYYIMLNDPTQTRVPFASGDRIPDRTYVVFKALMRDDPRDLLLDPGYGVGMTGFMEGTMSLANGGLYSFASDAAAVDESPTWEANPDGWAADTLGFLTGPSTNFTMTMQAVDEHGRRDGTPPSLSFDVGYEPCVQCVEILPDAFTPSQHGPDLACAEPGDASHPCFADTAEYRVTTNGLGSDELQFLQTAYFIVNRSTGYTEVVTNSAGYEASHYVVDARIYGMRVFLHGQDDPREFSPLDNPLWRALGWRYQVDYAADPYNLIRDGGGFDDITGSTWGAADGLDIDPLSGLWRMTVKIAVPTQLLNLGPDVYRQILLFTVAEQDPAAVDLIFDQTTRQFSTGKIRALALDQTECGALPAGRPATFNVFRGVRPSVAELPPYTTWRDCDLQSRVPEIKHGIPLSGGVMASNGGVPLTKHFRLIAVTGAGEFVRE